MPPSVRSALVDGGPVGSPVSNNGSTLSKSVAAAVPSLLVVTTIQQATAWDTAPTGATFTLLASQRNTISEWGVAIFAAQVSAGSYTISLAGNHTKHLNARLVQGASLTPGAVGKSGTKRAASLTPTVAGSLVVGAATILSNGNPGDLSAGEAGWTVESYGIFTGGPVNLNYSNGARSNPPLSSITAGNSGNQDGASCFVEILPG